MKHNEARALRLLMIDNYDSFTFNLVDYFKRLGHSVDVIFNDEKKPDEIDITKYEGLILSPGPGKPAQSGYLMDFVERFAEEIPILGICLGHQALGIHFGCHLDHALQPVHGKTSEIHCREHPLFEGVPENLTVMRYHSLIVKNINENLLIPLASTSEAELMAFAHRTLPIAGLQFHPESILTHSGLQLLDNFCRWIGQFETAKCQGSYAILPRTS